MELRQLQCFMSVAKHQGFRKGADYLNVAQPAVSRHIKRLEAELGHKLFQRAYDGARLTVAGQVLYRRSQELFDHITDIQTELAGVSGDVSGIVRVGAASSIAELLLAPLTDRVHRELPHVQLSIFESGCRLLGLLEEGQLDIAVLSCPWRMEGQGWDTLPLAGERVYLAGPETAHLGTKPISIARALAYPLVLSPSPNAQRLILEREARKHGKTLSVIAESESLHGQASLVKRGMGFAVLPYSAAKLMAHEHPISMIEISKFYTWRTMVWRSDRRSSRAEDAVRQIILREVDRLIRDHHFGPPIKTKQPNRPEGNN